MNRGLRIGGGSRLGGLGAFGIKGGGVSDTTPPTVAITLSKSAFQIGDTATITFTFSEVPTNFTSADVTAPNGTLSSFGVTGNPLIYTAVFTPTILVVDNTNVITVGTSWSDAAGNPPAGATNSANYTIDTTVFDPTGLTGALPAPFVGSTWALGSNVAANTPTEGSNLLTNGDMETWASDTDLSNWTETPAGTSTFNKEDTVKHGGNFAARWDVDASGNAIHVKSEDTTLRVGDWFIARAWAKSSAAGKVIIVSPFPGSVGGAFLISLTTSYVQYSAAGRATSLTGGIYQFEMYTNGSASSSIYADDLTVNKITASSLFASLDAGVSDVTVKGAWTIVSGASSSFAGVIMNADSASNPQNFLYLAHNGVANLTLWKCVNGAYTQVYANTGLAYVAGANIELRKTAATTYQVWYNGSQVGADQTINEATINSNTIHGVFSTGGGNSLNRFFVG